MNSDELTLDEVKALAKKFGYHLIKDKENVKLLPCICGGKRRLHFYNSKKGEFLVCDQCFFEGKPGNTEYEAKLGWNEAIEEACKCANA